MTQNIVYALWMMGFVFMVLWWTVVSIGLSSSKVPESPLHTHIKGIDAVVEGWLVSLPFFLYALLKPFAKPMVRLGLPLILMGSVVAEWRKTYILVRKEKKRL